ncbi:MAG: caspase family protein, partial [Bacteroidota bacterium]
MTLKSLFSFYCSLVLTAQMLQAQQPKLILPVASTNKLQDMELSRDEKYAGTIDLDGVIKYWDVATGHLLQTFSHPSGISVALTHDNRYLISASLDYTLQVWDLDQGVLIRTLKQEQQHALSCIKISPDGNWLVSGDQNGTVILWNINTWKPVQVYLTKAGYVADICFDHQGKWFAVAADATVFILGYRDNQPLFTLKGHREKVHALDISDNDQWLLSASWDSTARLWNMLTGKTKMIFRGHTNSLFDAHFSPDQKNIVTAANDNTIRIWDISNGTTIKTLKGHKDWVTKLRFSPDGKMLISISFDNTARIWAYPSGQLLHELKGHKGDLYYIAVLERSGQVLAGSYDNDISSWDLRSGKLNFYFGIHNETITSASVSNNGKYALTTYRDGRLKIIDLANGKITLNINGHDDWATSALFCNNDSVVVSAGTDNKVKVWQLPSGTLLADAPGDAGSIVANLAISKDSRYILSYGGESFSVFDMQKGKRIRFPASGSSFNPPVLSNTGKYIAAIGAGQIWIVGTDSGNVVKKCNIGSAFPQDLLFSPDDQYFLCIDKTPKIFKVVATDTAADNGQNYNDSLFLGLYWSKDMKTLLLVDSAMRLHFTDFASRKTKMIIQPDPSCRKDEMDQHFQGIIISGDDQYFASKHNDYFRLWNINNGKCLGRYPGDNFMFIPGTDKFLLTNRGAMNVYEAKRGSLVYTHFIAGENDYIVMDSLGRFDGTEMARKQLYFTCGKEIIELESVKDQLWVPNLAERIMKGETINAKTVSELNICGLTPEVQDLGNTLTEYHFKIIPRRGGMGETVVFVNGIEAKRYQPASLVKNGNSYDLVIKKSELINFLVNGKENAVVVKAYTADNTISSRGLIVSEDKTKEKPVAPNLYAVMVGVSDYKGDALDLKYAAKDATDISNAVSNAARKLLNTDEREHVFMYNLTTAKEHYQLPEKNAIKKIMEEIGKKATANDILLIFFAGHGVMSGEADKKQFYFLTADASTLSTTDAVKDVGISTSELVEWMKPQNIKAQKRILIFDACNSGQAINDIAGKELVVRNDDKAQQIKAIDKLNEKSGLFILSASASNQSAYEMGRYSQGLLTYSLLKAIKQQPDILEDGKYLNVSSWFNA